MSPDSDSEPLVSPAAEEGSASSASERSQPRPAQVAPSRGRHRSGGGAGGANMLPERERRPPAERTLMRLVATCGIVGIGTAISAIMISTGAQGWITGLVVSIVSVVLAAVLWSSRVL